jgi:hypothetical protein
MTTVFDGVTVACFAVLVIAFFQFSDRETRTLAHFVLVGIVLAVANQVGNAGGTILAVVLILAGLSYAGLMARR